MVLRQQPQYREGFQVSWQQAIRHSEEGEGIENEEGNAKDDADTTTTITNNNNHNSQIDWTPHTVDYGLFKQRLKRWCERRYQIRNLLSQNKDLGGITLHQLATVLGPTVMSTEWDQAFGGTNNNNRRGSPVRRPLPNPVSQCEEDDPEKYNKNHNNNDGLWHEYYVNLQQLEDQQATGGGGGGGMPFESTNTIDKEASLLSSSSSSSISYSTHRMGRTAILRMLSYMDRKDLVDFLRSELSKVHMFYLSQWQFVSQMLEDNHQDPEEDKVITHLKATAEEILELKAFCVMNVITVYQILIRFDAYARTYDGTPILDYWIKHNRRFANSTPFGKILQHTELTALEETFESIVKSSSSSTLLLSPTRYDTFTTVWQSFDSQRRLLADVLMAAETGQHMASSGHTLFRDSVVHTLRTWFLLASFEDRLGLEPSYLLMRGQSLNGEMRRLVRWRQSKQSSVLSRPTSPPPSPTSPMAAAAAAATRKKELSDMQVFHLTLNLLSAFLYCMNYYIVEPSSTMYVNRLGSFDAMSGTLIGMVPLAAFVSSIPYSMWTNHSFRQPFIVSSCLLVLGNLLYSTADQFRDIRIALLGRFITGLGAPKCIVRRYMADTTPMSLRTNVNAMFGMVVAAGSAMGPAMAIVLNSFEFTFDSQITGLVILNGLTLPGYFMAVLWITFTVIVLLTFEEPDREGLEEQRLLESTTGRATPANDFSSIQSQRSLTEHNDINTIFSGDDSQENGPPSYWRKLSNTGVSPTHADELPVPQSLEVPKDDLVGWKGKAVKYYLRTKEFTELITTPVRICLLLLFAKVFTIEILVSATSALSKNRYKWKVHNVGSLGLVNGILVIPFSVLVGRLSLSLQDRQLMRYLVTAGIFGFFLLIDLTDLVYSKTSHYNAGHVLAVGPERYVTGYFVTYLSVQTFEGVIGSTLSKVIPTALASGTFNSGLLATLVDTLGRACGDNFISMVGYFSIRQLMNLLYIPAFLIMLTCLIVIERCRDILSV